MSVQPISVHNFSDPAGNPEGGVAYAAGLCVSFQRGPLGRGAERVEPNGCFVETLLEVAIRRLEFYQDSKFNSSHNANALNHLNMALGALTARTAERETRGVEGTYES